MTSENLRIVLMSDLHLNTEDDFSFGTLDDWLEGRAAQDKLPDLVTVHGDVVDNIPRDREDNEELRSRDIGLGRYFFKGMDNLGRDYGFHILKVSGNHDHDIYDSLGHDDVGNEFSRVHDISTDFVYSGDLGLGSDVAFIGYGANSFDIGPEVRREDFDSLESISADEFERALDACGAGNSGAEYVADKLGVSKKEWIDAVDQIQNYHSEYERFSSVVEEALGEAEPQNLVVLSHIAPFNTALDSKEIGGEKSENQGSIVLKNGIKNYQPFASFSGHHDYEQLDVIRDEHGDGTYALGLEEAQPYEIIIGSDSGSTGFTYSQL